MEIILGRMRIIPLILHFCALSVRVLFSMSQHLHVCKSEINFSVFFFTSSFPRCKGAGLEDNLNGRLHALLRMTPSNPQWPSELELISLSSFPGGSLALFTDSFMACTAVPTAKPSCLSKELWEV